MSVCGLSRAAVGVDFDSLERGDLLGVAGDAGLEDDADSVGDLEGSSEAGGLGYLVA